MPLLISSTIYTAEPTRPSALSRLCSAVMAVLSVVGIVYIGNSLRQRQKERNRRGRMKKDKKDEEMGEVAGISKSSIEAPGPPEFLQQIEGKPNEAGAEKKNQQKEGNSSIHVDSSTSTGIPPVPLVYSSSPLIFPMAGEGQAVKNSTNHLPMTERDTRVFFDFLHLYAHVDAQDAVAQSLAVQLAQAAATAQTLAAARAYSASVPNSPSKNSRARDSLGRAMAEAERLQAGAVYSRVNKRRKNPEGSLNRANSFSGSPTTTANQPPFTPATPFPLHSRSHSVSYIQPVPFPPTTPAFSASFSQASQPPQPQQPPHPQPPQPPNSHWRRSSFTYDERQQPSASQLPPVPATSRDLVNSLLQHQRDQSLPASLLKKARKPQTRPGEELSLQHL